MNTKRAWRVLGLGAVVLLAAVGALVGGSALAKRLPVPEAQAAAARAGVTANAEWTPVIRRRGGLDMALAPAGCFWMGSTDDELAVAQDSCDRFFGARGCTVDFAAREQPQHRVCFAEPFWIGATEVTNRQYGSSSSTDMIAMYRGPNWPRETVTWAEGGAFCAARGLRLPTEAEWEYAARGPDGWLYPWGNEFDPLNLIWHVPNPVDVGRQRDISWVGAHDLAGSVEEWAADWYGLYAAGPQTDPPGPATGERRVTRGGSWFSYATYFVRGAQRTPQRPDYATSVAGFRCAADWAP